jgi:hypothetical protein
VSKPSYELAHCIVCGHTDATPIADADAVRREVEMLWEYHQTRLRPETPPAHLVDRVTFSEHAPFRLVRCRGCGLVYRNPVERAHELAAIYENTAPAVDALRTLHATQLPTMRGLARALRARLGGSGCGLEVGSYVGAFLAAARDEGLRFEGLDVNPSVNTFVRTLGFVVHDGDLTKFSATEKDRAFDAIAIWNAFDQLSDPRATLTTARSLMAAGAALAIRVPNGGFYAAWRHALENGNVVRRGAARTLLAQNNLLTFPYRWGFTPLSLARLLAMTGYRVTDVRGAVLVPTADRWTRPWARVEEAVMKWALATPARLKTAWAPWFEIYATARAAGGGGHSAVA